MQNTKLSRTTLIIGLICSGIFVLMLSGYSLYQSRLQYEHQAETLSQNIAGAIDQNLSSSIEKIDLAMRTVADELEHQLATGGINEASVISFIARQEQRLPEVEAFRVANADGLVIFGKGLNKSERLNWTDRDYYIYHRDHPLGQLHIAKPRMGRVAKQYIMGFSRRYNHPDGSFAGVISAPISINHFTQILSGFELGAHGTTILRYSDYGLITRFPAIPDQTVGQVGTSVVSPQLQLLLDSGTPFATYFTPTGADGFQRIVTFRRLAKAPIIVLAATATDDYLANWWKEVYQTSAMAIAFLLLLGLSGGLLLHQLAKAERRDKILRQSLQNGQRQHESLRHLNEVAASAHLPLQEQFQQALAIGSKLFGLEFGIVSHVVGTTYQVVTQISPPDTLHDGQEFPFGVTYCNITIESGGVVAISKMVESPYATHPCYEQFKLEAYIGAPVIANGVVFGTVNFSSPLPYHREFDEIDQEFIALLARWIGSAIERDQAQQKLANNERQLQAIIDTEPECVKILAPDGTLLQMNRAGLEMIEADSLEQVIGKSLLGIIAESDRKAFMSLGARVNQGESGTLEFEIIGLKGVHRCLETHAVPMRDNEERITGLLGVTRDVSERKQHEAELQHHHLHLEKLVEQRTSSLLETEARASHILESSADGLYGVDRDGVITFINPAACEMLGYSPEQVIGRGGHTLFHHSRPDGSPYPITECPSHNALQLGEAVRIDNEVYWHADGHAVPVMYAIHPMVQNGHTTGAVISFVDMSEQRAASLARERALIAAENLAKVRSEFLANMSHEIRTPLNGVLGFADIGHRNYQNCEKAREAFEKIQFSGKRLLGVINDVLDFSKIEAGKLKIEQTEVLISEVINHAIELVRERADAKHLNLSVDMAPDLPRTCISDPLRLGQILLNVLANAVKFTEHGDVALSVSRQEMVLTFRIEDSGIGMNEAQLSELFNPFQQADASASRRFGGTGLGLAICKRILELMNGKINVRSQLGKGTTVEFSVPYVVSNLAAASMCDIKDDEPRPTMKPLAGMSILVAEDEEINRTILEENLTEDGARVVSVSNGREAVERILMDGPDAYDFVLMDIQMPEMDGFEATRRILEFAPDLPIIAQTAHAFSEERDRCLATGMVGHLAKPIDTDALHVLVLQFITQVELK
jgi:PAS domain S-box-containing protein